ncbi:MAG: hypothetical protein AAF901_03725 [Bacteroidota bacterium]
MKKLLVLLFVVCAVLSCRNDDDATVPQCLEPTNITVDNITFNSATVNWMDDNASATFSIEYGISGFIQGTGTTLVSSSTSIDLVNLLANTTYDVYIKSDCSVTNFSLWSEVESFTTLPELVVPEFRTNLSELNLFSGDLGDLILSPYTFEYQLHTSLFTDYAHKQRIIALPEGEALVYDGDGFPIFPDNTVIAKTFFYNNDERDASLGRQIIETRILIKTNGAWDTGDYRWNAEQTDAVLDLEGGDVPISWIDADGDTNNITYSIPSNTDCFTCHNTYNNITPIGPKLRTMNFEINGVNQLQQLIDDQRLTGLSDVSTVSQLPNWEDTTLPLEERARAYFDVNCAHCHIPGGFCETQSTLDLAYETPFANSNIFERRNSILNRVSVYIPGFSMPFIGTTTLHDEGVDLIEEYLNSL